MIGRTALSLLVAAASIVSAVPMQKRDVFSISAPETISQCTPATFTWTQTSGPYYLTVIESNSNPTPQSIFDMSPSSSEEVIVVRKSNSASWIVDSPAGSQVRVLIRDASGEIAQTASMVVAAGPDGCL